MNFLCHINVIHIFIYYFIFLFYAPFYGASQVLLQTADAAAAASKEGEAL